MSSINLLPVSILFITYVLLSYWRSLCSSYAQDLTNPSSRIANVFSNAKM